MCWKRYDGPGTHRQLVENDEDVIVKQKNSIERIGLEQDRIIEDMNGLALHLSRISSTPVRRFRTNEPRTPTIKDHGSGMISISLPTDGNHPSVFDGPKEDDGDPMWLVESHCKRFYDALVRYEYRMESYGPHSISFRNNGGSIISAMSLQGRIDTIGANEHTISAIREDVSLILFIVEIYTVYKYNDAL